MKWLKSTTQKTWTVGGRIIPACVTSHNDYLVLDDSLFTELTRTPVIKSLITAGAILVLSEEPAELKNSVEAFRGDKAALTAEITQLREQLKQKELEATPTVDVEKLREEAQAEIKAQAIKELEEKEAEIAKLKKQLAKVKSGE